MQKVYLDENNHITVCCPQCNKVKEIDATPFLKSTGPTKISFRFKCTTCECGHKDCAECIDCNCKNANVIAVERRKHFRKSVNLPGFFVEKGGNRHSLRVLDLSRTGLKAKILGHHSLSLLLDQVLLAEFTLDDAKETLIKKKFVVRKIKDKQIEGQFTEKDEYGTYDKAIGFYLMS